MCINIVRESRVVRVGLNEVVRSRHWAPLSPIAAQLQASTRGSRLSGIFANRAGQIRYLKVFLSLVQNALRFVSGGWGGEIIGEGVGIVVLKVKLVKGFFKSVAIHGGWIGDNQRWVKG
jgi:hypothetical protein